MRDIKRRIRSVQNTQKITRAMKMVAAAKLRRAQERAEGARTFFEATRSIFKNVANAVLDETHPLLVDRGGKKVGYLVITADRGLAGGYNVKMNNEVEQHIEDKSKTSLITVGRKGRDYFKRRGYNIVSEYLGIEDYPDFRIAKKISAELIQLYEAEVFDRVYLGYMRFQSAMTQIPTIIPLLPVVPEKKEEGRRIDYIYEPSAVEVLDWILPRYVENIIYSALLEAKASEFGARMTAMDNATENAQEMIDNLILSYNRARQAAITTEISEIVGGAEALK
ncbi:ATP synthase F1 subunit gamma [Anoxybacter fermentans]